MSKQYYTDKNMVLISYFEEEKYDFITWLKTIKYIKLLYNA